MKKDKKKILLIQPPFYRLYKESLSLVLYPLSLGYLAGTIKERTDWEVKVFNADYSSEQEEPTLSFLAGKGFQNYLNNLKNTSGPVWQEVRAVIREQLPAVVGITCNTPNFRASCLVAQICKEIDSQICVVAGGPHPSMVHGKVLDCPDIDIAVYGEGERTIVELLQHLESGKSLKDVHGIVYRENGQLREAPPQEYIVDLDSLCFPSEAAPEVLIDYEKYPPQAFGDIFSTRGCPFNCFFCGSRHIWSRRVRFRSPANVVAEIQQLMARGVLTVHFSDDTFGINAKFIREICLALMNDCPGLKWSCTFHVKLVNDEIIRLMKAAGCEAVYLGVESGNDEVLKKIRKNCTIKDAFAAVNIIRREGVSVSAFFMIGFPFETEEMIHDTIRAIKKIDCDSIVYSIFTPYPGTEAYDYCLRHGLIPENFDFSMYNHQSPLNWFSQYISQAKFRKLARKTEHLVDRKNFFAKISRVVSLKGLQRLRTMGFREALAQGMKLSKKILQAG